MMLLLDVAIGVYLLLVLVVHVDELGPILAQRITKMIIYLCVGDVLSLFIQLFLGRGLWLLTLMLLAIIKCIHF